MLTREFKLTSSDGGRTWLPGSGNSNAQLISGLEADARGILSLVLPKAVSMFPLTAPMSPLAAHLNGDVANDGGQRTTHSTAIFDQKLQPLYEVFEAQPVRFGSDNGEAPKTLEAIVVISRAVPRPTKVSTWRLYTPLLTQEPAWLSRQTIIQTIVLFYVTSITRRGWTFDLTMKSPTTSTRPLTPVFTGA